MIVYHRASAGYFDVVKGSDARMPECVLPIVTNIARAAAMPTPGTSFVRVRAPENDGDVSPNIECVGDYFPLGDAYVSDDEVLFLPSESAKALRFFYVGEYKGGNDLVRYIFPTALLTDPIARATDTPAKAFCICPGGYLTLINDENLFGFDAEHYMYKQDEMIGVGMVKEASLPFFPYPQDEKSAAFINRVVAGAVNGGSVSLLGTYTSPEDGIVLFNNENKAATESFRTCFKKGIPFDNLDKFRAHKLVTKNGLKSLETEVLFGSNTWSDKAAYTVYYGASADLRVAEVIKRGSEIFDDGDLFDINDEVSKIIADADIEGKKAYVAYYDSIVTSVVEYAEKVRNYAGELGNRIVADSLGRELNVAGAAITINEPLLEVTTAAVPPKGGNSEEYADQIVTMFGKGMDPENMAITEELDNSVKDQVSRRLGAINDVIDEATGLVSKAMGSFNVVDTSSYSKGYWCFGDRSVSRPSVYGSEMSRSVKKVVMTKNANQLTFTLQFAFTPFAGVNYKVGEDNLVARVKTAMASAFSQLGISAKFVGLGDYCMDRGKAAWWWHDKATPYRCFMGVHEFRDHYMAIPSEFDVCREQLWEFSFIVNLPSTVLELDLTASNDSAVRYFKGKATSARWMAFAKYVVTHLENAVDILKNREPFVRVDGIIYTLEAASAFGIPLMNVDSLGDAIVTLEGEKSPETVVELTPAIQILEFIRDTIMQRAGGITPLTYITESDIENAVSYAEPDILPVCAFSIVTEE